MTLLAMALYLSICLSSRYCIKTAERMELVFVVEATLGLSYIVLQGNSGIWKNKGILSSGNLPPNSGLRKISPWPIHRHKCCQLPTDQRRQFITLSVHICVPHYARVGRVRLRQLKLVRTV